MKTTNEEKEESLVLFCGLCWMYFLHSFTGKCTFTGKYSSLERPLNISVKLSPLKSTTDSVDIHFSQI